VNRARVIADLAPPPGWQAVPAGAVLTPVARTGHPDEPLLSVSKYRGVHLRRDGDSHSRPSEDLGNYLLALPGDLVVNIMLAWDRGLGVTSERGLVSPAYATYTPDEALVDPCFLNYQVRSDPAIAEWRRRSYGIQPSRWRIYWERMSSAKLLLPPLEMQRRVADMLDDETARIDTLIAKNQRAEELAQLQLRETIARSVTLGTARGPEVRRTGADWAPETNKDWGWAPYQYLAVLGTGHTPSRSDASLWEDCNIPWLTTGDVKHLRDHRREHLDDTEHKLSERGLANSAARLLPARTVALSRTASVGFSVIMSVPMATSQDFFTWTCDERKLLPEYLLYVLRAMKFRGHFDRLMYGSTHKTIYFPDLVQLRGPVPPVAEQRDIVDHVRAKSRRAHELISRIGKMTELLQRRRQALITAAVTGQIDV
jgi:type I restriction enzyme, S subunit